MGAPVHVVCQHQRMHQQRRLRLRRWPRSAVCGASASSRCSACAVASALAQVRSEAQPIHYMHAVLLVARLYTDLYTLDLSACNPYSNMKQCGSQQHFISNPDCKAGPDVTCAQVVLHAPYSTHPLQPSGGPARAGTPRRRPHAAPKRQRACQLPLPQLLPLRSAPSPARMANDM